ncbi:MAG: ABC transporter permease subunit [Armatimonadetes bacterium]|nr:ABC transporter permease subunit [Armatimonadota bacterium]
MRNVLTVTARELYSYFCSPMAYVVVCFFLGIISFIFALYIGSGRAEARMEDLFHTMAFLSLMVAPVLTMGLIAQERNLGTIETLLTKPVTDLEVALGKFLAALVVFLFMLGLTLIYPLIMEKYGDPDWGAILMGYLGLVLAGAAFLAIGLFTSSLTSNQIAAAVLGLLILLFFWLVGWLSYSVSQSLGDVMKHLSVYENLQDFEKGIFDTKPLFYFLSLAFYFLFLAVRSLESRRA